MGHLRRLLELTFLLAFGLVEIATTVFDQYPVLVWLGGLVVLAILVDSLRCARCQWRRLRENGGNAEESPG